nr:DCL family protein [uncultured Pseudomonas sp.]
MYWLGPFEYRCKQALLDGLKEYLRTARMGRVSHPIAIQKLHLLLALHPDAERKIGVGVDHFLIVKNELSGRGFRLVRSDGTEDSFSYSKCITGVPQSPHGKACEALRFAVRPQLDAFRAQLAYPVTCAISGEPIVHPNDLHVDHEKPFWRLLAQFCREHQVDLSSLETTGNGMRLTLKDSKVRDAFISYHLKYAKLQASRRVANLLKGGSVAVPHTHSTESA